MLLDPSGRPIDVSMTPREHPLAPGNQGPRQVEVVRSFSFKLNLGNYQSADFFCSQKAQCSPGELDEVSIGLYDWCYEQVMDSVKDVQAKQAAKIARIEAERAAAAAKPYEHTPKPVKRANGSGRHYDFDGEGY